jgi:hypothetical protein
VFSSEDCPEVVTITNASELLRNTLHVWDIHRAQRLLLFTQATATLGVDDRVNEALGITIELEFSSQAADFFNQILSFLAYGGSSVVKTLDQTSFYMRRMVGVEAEVSASVGWFPVDSGD